MPINQETLTEWVLLGLNPAPGKAHCKYCGASNLEWVQSPSSKWYLVGVEGDKLKMHSCSAKPGVKFQKVKFK